MGNELKTTRQKQILRVLDAINAGCDTSRSVADLTGLSVATASANLSELHRMGAIRLVKRRAVKFSNMSRGSNIYALPEPMAAEPVLARDKF